MPSLSLRKAENRTAHLNCGMTTLNTCRKNFMAQRSDHHWPERNDRRHLPARIALPEKRFIRNPKRVCVCSHVRPRIFFGARKR